MQRRISLQAPIIRIFEDRLKPRLHGIPTPQQKAAVRGDGDHSLPASAISPDGGK